MRWWILTSRRIGKRYLLLYPCHWRHVMYKMNFGTERVFERLKGVRTSNPNSKVY